MTEVLAPCPGTVLPLEQIPDPVFAGAMVGAGVGLDPDAGPTTVRAPIAGRVVKAHPHAFVIAGADGVGVLVHLGINTVALDGAGFTVHAATGDTMQVGDPMVDWDPATLPEETGGTAISPIVPVVVLDAPAEAISAAAEGHVAGGEPLFRH